MNVDVVIVTYNRLEKLKKALACYETQTMTFRNMIVVNNHSNDGTFEYLESWKNIDAPFAKHVVNMEDNLGGSGGFYTGQKYAMALNPDWIYLADDDAYAEPDMMEQFYKFCDSHDVDKMSAICGAVYGMDGKLALSHRSTYKISGKNHYERVFYESKEYLVPFFFVDYLSYVCSYLNVGALRKVGLVNSSYFIYYDDTEHSIRLRKYGKIACVPSIKIYHEEGGGGTSPDLDTTWQEYYRIRNQCHMLKKHRIMLAVDKTLYMRKELRSNRFSKEKASLIRSAFFDAWISRLGKHSKYKPGWNVKKKKYN